MYYNGQSKMLNAMIILYARSILSQLHIPKVIVLNVQCRFTVFPHAYPSPWKAKVFILLCSERYSRVYTLALKSRYEGAQINTKVSSAVNIHCVSTSC